MSARDSRQGGAGGGGRPQPVLALAGQFLGSRRTTPAKKADLSDTELATRSAALAGARRQRRRELSDAHAHRETIHG